jgi:AbiV family abortive infection protein
MTTNSSVQNATSYSGDLTPVDAANAIRSARLTALDLTDTAEILFTLKRFQHSAAMSILAIEEASKLSVVLMIFLEMGGDRKKHWKSYRNHRAKTAWLNPVIESRVRATFPQIPREEARKAAEAGPTPNDLESSKQHALYSDCFEVSGKFVAHCPNLAEWRAIAWDRMWEAKAMTSGMRDYQPAELAIWRKHFSRPFADKKEVTAALSTLHEELLENKFIKDGWWKTLLEDAEVEANQP